MTRRRLRHRFSLAPVLILALAAGGPPERRPRASPRAILFYGGSLPTPVLIQGHAATSLFLGALAPDTAMAASDTIPIQGTAGRVSVAVFWLNRPVGTPETDTLPVAAFHPFDSDQRGRLYPAGRRAPALLIIDAGSGFPPARKRVTARAARMLTERGAPVGVLLP